MTAFTVRVPDDIAEKLERIARKIDRSRSYTAAEAIEEYVERQEWQLAEVEAGLADAEAGDFASPQELAGVIARYVKPAPNS